MWYIPAVAGAHKWVTGIPRGQRARLEYNTKHPCSEKNALVLSQLAAKMAELQPTINALTEAIHALKAEIAEMQSQANVRGLGVRRKA